MGHSRKYPYSSHGGNGKWVLPLFGHPRTTEVNLMFFFTHPSFGWHKFPLWGRCGSFLERPNWYQSMTLISINWLKLIIDEGNFCDLIDRLVSIIAKRLFPHPSPPPPPPQIEGPMCLASILNEQMSLFVYQWYGCIRVVVCNKIRCSFAATFYHWWLVRE